jgi:hypothetical protein
MDSDPSKYPPSGGPTTPQMEMVRNAVRSARLKVAVRGLLALYERPVESDQAGEKPTV